MTEELLSQGRVVDSFTLVKLHAFVVLPEDIASVHSIKLC